MRRYTIWLYCTTLVFALLVLPKGRTLADEVAIVALNGSGQVAFIDIENEEVIKTIALNVPYPHFVETTPDANTAVVVCDAGHICFVDVATMEGVTVLELLWGPEQHGITLQPNEFQGLCITPESLALVTEANERGQLFFIDTRTMEVAGDPWYVSGEPESIISTSDGSRAYYVDEGSIYYVDTLLWPAVSYGMHYYQPTGSDEIGGLDLIPNDESRALLCDCDNRIFLIHIGARVILDQQQVDRERFTEPSSLKVSPAGTMAIVANSTDPSITFVAIEGNTLAVEETLEVGGPADCVAFTQDGQTAVVTIPRTSEVKIIDVPGRQVRATIKEELGLAPLGVTITARPAEPVPNETSETDLK